MPIPTRITSSVSVLLLAILVAGCGGDATTPSTEAKVVPASDSTSSDRAAAAAGAVPTAQVAAAHGIELRASVKQYVNSIEACAASNTDGSYTGCLDTAALLQSDPALAQVPGDVTVAPGSDPTLSYSVSVTADGQTFAEAHGGDGTITKTCAPVDAAGCQGGRW